MKDYLGNEMEIGDKVVHSSTYSKSGRLDDSVIAGFTNTMVIFTDGHKKSPQRCVVVEKASDE